MNKLPNKLEPLLQLNIFLIFITENNNGPQKDFLDRVLMRDVQLIRTLESRGLIVITERGRHLMATSNVPSGNSTAMLHKDPVKRPNCTRIQNHCKENGLQSRTPPESLLQWTSSRKLLPRTVDTKINNLSSQQVRLPNFAFEEPVSKEFLNKTIGDKEFIKSTLKKRNTELENQIVKHEASETELKVGKAKIREYHQRYGKVKEIIDEQKKYLNELEKQLNKRAKFNQQKELEDQERFTNLKAQIEHDMEKERNTNQLQLQSNQDLINVQKDQIQQLQQLQAQVELQQQQLEHSQAQQIQQLQARIDDQGMQIAQFKAQQVQQLQVQPVQPVAQPMMEEPEPEIAQVTTQNLADVEDDQLVIIEEPETAHVLSENPKAVKTKNQKRRKPAEFKKPTEVKKKCGNKSAKINKKSGSKTAEGFKCTKCAKVFSHTQSRNKHIMVAHEHVGRVICDMCNTSFSLKSALFKHYKRNSCPVLKSGRRKN